MIDSLKSLAIFREVVTRGSFRAAAQYLNLSPSVISQHISALEDNLNSKLLYRTTRKLKLTESGKSLFNHAEAMCQHANRGLAEIAQKTGELTGKRTITLPSAMLQSPWLTGLAKFAKAHERLTLSLEFSDEQLDLVENNIDLAFRTGQLKDSQLKCKKIGGIERKLVASPQLLQTLSTPQDIQQLSVFPWVYLNRLPARREFVHDNGTKNTINYSAAITVNSVIALKDLTLQGLGVSTPPSYLVETELASGALVEICKPWQIPDIPLYLVWPDSPENSLLVERLLPHIQEKSDLSQSMLSQ
ncbi:LysR family transcriptional regulator [Planctobacterium marinum]